MEEVPELEILYQDDYLVAINKPHGLLVHRSSRAREASVFALQTLRNQLGRHVWPAHRIDRKTGGVLLFALDADTANHLQGQFARRETYKEYLTIVRGYTEDQGVIDYPLVPEDGRSEAQEAITEYETLGRVELPIAFGKHATSRYSLVRAMPKTGRMHQLRKHFKHIFHPIIGDRPHGCNKQNKLFLERWQLSTMMLHAARLQFTHHHTGQTVSVAAPLQSEFVRMIQEFGWQDLVFTKEELRRA